MITETLRTSGGSDNLKSGTLVYTAPAGGATIRDVMISIHAGGQAFDINRLGNLEDKLPTGLELVAVIGSVETPLAIPIKTTLNLMESGFVRQQLPAKDTDWEFLVKDFQGSHGQQIELSDGDTIELRVPAGDDISALSFLGCSVTGR